MAWSLSSSELELLAKPARMNVLDMSFRANSSHIGSSFSVIDLLICSYKLTTLDSNSRVILSKGHAAAAYYSVLAVFGKLAESELDSYCENGSLLTGHASHLVHKSITLSTGSLGHGLPYGAGIALANKINKINGKTIVVASDGELDEGTTWETALFSNHFNLRDLILIVDRNGLQSLASTEETIKLNPIGKKWESFGWDVIEINGHSYSEICNSLNSLLSSQNKPTCIVANTIKGFGIEFMENQVKWHYKSPNSDEHRLGQLELNQRFV
jgi:transketolase